jgi:hypothetical protein
VQEKVKTSGLVQEKVKTSGLVQEKVKTSGFSRRLEESLICKRLKK